MARIRIRRFCVRNPKLFFNRPIVVLGDVLVVTSYVSPNNLLIHQFVSHYSWAARHNCLQSVKCGGSDLYTYTYTLTQATLHFRHVSAGAGWGRAQEPGLTFPAARTTVPPPVITHHSLSAPRHPSYHHYLIMLVINMSGYFKSIFKDIFGYIFESLLTILVGLWH